MSSFEGPVRGPSSIEVGRVADAVEALQQCHRAGTLDDRRADMPIQALFAAATRLYAARLERDPHLAPFADGRDLPSATGALMAARAILAAVQIEPFELGLWATWGIGGPDTRDGGE